MDHNEQGRYVDGISSHPGNRPIIIGGSDSEHDLLVAAVYDRRKCSVTRGSPKLRTQEKIRLENLRDAVRINTPSARL